MKSHYIPNRLFTALIPMLCFISDGYGSPNDSIPQKIIHLIGADFKPGYIFPTHNFLKGVNLAHKPIHTTLSGYLKYGFQFSPTTRLGQEYPHTIQGIGIGYNTFLNSKEVGNPISVYAFQSSRIAQFSPNLSLDYEWNFGASFGWKKADKDTNPYNRVVGSKINAYIHLNFLLNWKISANTYLRGGIGATHFSNGNTNYPNSGINVLVGNFGFIHFFGKEENLKLSKPYLKRPPFKRHISYDLIVYGAKKKSGKIPNKNNPLVIPGAFAVAGLNFNPLYNFNRYFRAGLSLDAQYDESGNIWEHLANESLPSNPEDLRFYHPQFKEQFSIGFSLRVEFVMPIFSINWGIGRKIIYKSHDAVFYQTFVLKTNLTKHLFLHTGYQLFRFKDPNNLMLGIGWRFNRG